MVEIGLADLPKCGCAMAHPGTTGLHCVCTANFKVLMLYGNQTFFSFSRGIIFCSDCRIPFKKLLNQNSFVWLNSASNEKASRQLCLEEDCEVPMGNSLF